MNREPLGANKGQRAHTNQKRQGVRQNGLEKLGILAGDVGRRDVVVEQQQIIARGVGDAVMAARRRKPVGIVALPTFETIVAEPSIEDVRATIALARLIRQKQPKLYDWLFQLRSKHKVMEQISLLQPLVHISGRFSAARNYLGVVLPLAWHPRNRNALIVCDLHQETLPLLRESAEVLRQRLYTRHDELAEGELPVPLKLVQINRCPVVAPLSVLRAEDRQRTGIVMAIADDRQHLPPRAFLALSD